MRSSLLTFVVLCLTVPVLAQNADTQSLRNKAVQQRVREILEEKVHAHERRGVPPARKSQQTTAGAFDSPVMDIPSIESEIHAAVNPTDSANIIVAPIQVTFMQGISLPTFVTTDFGATWQETSTRYSGDGGGDPVLTFDADGTAYFSWLEFIPEDSGWRLTLYVSESNDKGFTWNVPTKVADGFINWYGLGRLVDKEWMDVDRSQSPRRNTLYVVYVELRATMESSLRIQLQNKPADRETFDPVVTLISQYEEFLTMQFPSVNVDADGNVHVFCWGIDSHGTNGLFHTVSKQEVLDDSLVFKPMEIMLAVRYPYFIDTPLEVPEHLPQRMGVLPQFAVDANQHSPHKNTLYAVWNCNDMESTEEPTYDEPMHVYLSASYDGGETWSKALRMDDAADREANQFHPSVTVSPSGAVIVTWYDGREARNNTDVHYYMAVSYDCGRTFGPNIRVTTLGTNGSTWDEFGIGDYDRAICTEHYAIPIWCDGRTNDGDLDVYAGFIPISTVTGIERVVPVTTGVRLQSPVPNPVASTANITFEVDMPTRAAIEVYDERGALMERLAASDYAPGVYTVPYNGTHLQPGVYFIRLQTGHGYAVQKMTVLR